MSYDICHNRHGGDECSFAADKITNKAKDRQRILDYLASVENATCDEVEVVLGMAHQTCSARFSELRAAGSITAASKRPTRTGCMANAYKIQAEVFAV